MHPSAARSGATGSPSQSLLPRSRYPVSAGSLRRPLPRQATPSSTGTLWPVKPLASLPVARQRSAPRSADVRDRPHRDPRRAQRDRPSLRAVHLRCAGPGRRRRKRLRSRRRPRGAGRRLLDLPIELFPPACGAAGIAAVEDAYTAALAAIPDGAAKSRVWRWVQAAAAAIVALAQRRPRQRRTTRRPQLSAGNGAGRVQVHARDPVRVRAQVGFGDAVRARRQHAVRERSAVPVEQQALRRRLQRGQALGRPRASSERTASRPRSPSSGSRARRWRGTGWPARSLSSAGSTCGRALACSGY